MGVVGSFLAATVVGLFTYFGQPVQTEQDYWSQEVIEQSADNVIDSLALQFIAHTNNVDLYGLSSDQVSTALQISIMSSNGQDYVIYSKNEELRRLHSKFEAYIIKKRTELGIHIDMPKRDV